LRFKRFKDSKIQKFKDSKDSRPLAREKDSENILWFFVLPCFCGKKHSCPDRYRDRGEKIQKISFAELPSVGSKIQGFKNSRIQKIQGLASLSSPWSVQRFKNSKIQEFKNSIPPRRIQDSKNILWFFVFLCFGGDKTFVSRSLSGSWLKDSKI